MDGEHGGFFDRFNLANFGLGDGEIHADDDITEILGHVWRGGEGEDIGRGVDVAVLEVELLDLWVVGKEDHNLAGWGLVDLEEGGESMADRFVDNPTSKVIENRDLVSRLCHLLFFLVVR